MENKGEKRHSSKYQYGLIMVISIVIGVICLVIYFALDKWFFHCTYASVLQTIFLSCSAAFLASSIIAWIQYCFLPNAVLEELKNNIKYYDDSYVNEINEIVITEKISDLFGGRADALKDFITRSVSSTTKLLDWSINDEPCAILDMHKYEIDLSVKNANKIGLSVVEYLEFYQPMKIKNVFNLLENPKGSGIDCIIINDENGQLYGPFDLERAKRELREFKDSVTLKIVYKTKIYDNSQMRELFKFNFPSKQLFIEINNNLISRIMHFHLNCPFYNLSELLDQGSREIEVGQNTPFFTMNNKKVSLKLNHSNKIITAKDSFVLIVE